MFIYFHWPKAGNYTMQAFYKGPQAFEYVINQIEHLIGSQKPKKKAALSNNQPVFIPGQNFDQEVAAVRMPQDDIDFDPYHPEEARINNIFNIPPAAPGPAPAPYIRPAQAAVRNMPRIVLEDAVEAIHQQLTKGFNKTINEKKISSEFLKLQEHIEMAKKDPTICNAVKAIELYEDYLRYVVGNESAIHTLQETDIVE